MNYIRLLLAAARRAPSEACGRCDGKGFVRTNTGTMTCPECLGDGEK